MVHRESKHVQSRALTADALRRLPLNALLRTALRAREAERRRPSSQRTTGFESVSGLPFFVSFSPVAPLRASALCFISVAAMLRSSCERALSAAARLRSDC